MEETKIDRETMGRLAKALAFIRKPDDPVVIAFKLAADPTEISSRRAPSFSN